MGNAKDRIIFKVDVPANRNLPECDSVDGAWNSTAMLGVQERWPTDWHEHLPQWIRGNCSKLRIHPFWMEFLGKSLGFSFGAHLFIRPFGALKCYFLTTYTSQYKIQKFRNLLETPSLWKKHVGELCNPGVWTTEFAWVVGREMHLSVWMGWFVQQIIFCFEGLKSEDVFFSTIFLMKATWNWRGKLACHTNLIG